MIGSRVGSRQQTVNLMDSQSRRWFESSPISYRQCHKIKMIDKKDLKIETMRGSGPGGQHKNKTDSCVRATHIPSGLSVTIDGRNQSKNKKEAISRLEELILEKKEQELAAKKKALRDQKIKDRKYVRTYDFKKKQVVDHRSKKRAPLDEVLYKGKFELLRPEDY